MNVEHPPLNRLTKKPVTTPEIFKESFSYNLGHLYVDLAISSVDCNDLKVLGSLKTNKKTKEKQQTNQQQFIK